MKKRSLLTIVLLTIVTLGLYELYWLVVTRNEMTSKFNLKLPAAIYLITLSALQIVGLLAVVFILLYAIPANNRKIDAAQGHKPSAQCYGAYNSNAECKKEIDNYYVTDNSVTLLFMVLAIIILNGLLGWYYITHWLKSYGVAVEKVTQGGLSASAAILAYGLLPLIGMLFIQQAFNKTQSIPQYS